MSLRALKARLEALQPAGKLKAELFPQQLTFISDTAHRKAALCTRRAGKSHVAAIALILAAISKSNTVALYLALTRRSAKAIMWFKLKELDRIYKLGLTFSESELIVHFTNGSRIVLFGADLENLADRLRGDAYIRVVIDEAQSYGSHLQMLIDDVLEPATLDHRGDIVLIGTPGPSPIGTFFEATTNATSWSTHKWSLLDNPHLPHAAEWLTDLRASRGWTDENPTWRREYLGEWVQDESALVYRGFKRHRNVFKLLPAASWEYIIGMDLGWHDQTTFSVVAYSKHQPCAYVVRSFGRSELHISRIAEVLGSLVNEFSPIAIIADTGGLGKSICEELKSRYSLPIRAAEKTEKMTAIEAMNGDFIDGRILIHESCTDLMTQYEQLTWDEKRLHENPSMRNDLCDCSLYALRFSRHYWHCPKAPPLTCAELVAKQERDMLDSVIECQQQIIQEREENDPSGAFGLFKGATSVWGSSSEDW